MEDEFLIQQLNKAVSAESERLKKMKTNRNRATAAAVSASSPAVQPEYQTGAEKNREDQIMATLQAVKSEMATLREKVEKQSLSSSKASTGEKRPKRACKKCTEENVADKCDHCFHCGSSEHWSMGCRKRESGRMQASGNRQRLQLRDKK